MKTLFIFALLTAVILSASVSCSAVDFPDVSGLPDDMTTITTQAIPPLTATSVPIIPTLPAVNLVNAAPNWQLCTWILYGLYAEPSVIHVGQPAKIWAFLYVEDFPVTDVNTELLVNGVVVDRKVVTLTYDEAWPFFFTYVPEKAGVYDITVRAILDINAHFADLPDGDSNYTYVHASMTVQA